MKHDYKQILEDAGRQAAMAACWADIREVFRKNWDAFAIYDFYNQLLLEFGNGWKVVRWTSNYNIMCCIVEVSAGETKQDITFFARYDKTNPRGYRSAKYVTIKQNAI